MEDKTYLQSHEDLEEDALSLCDLSINDVNAELEEPNSFSSYSDSPSRPDLFEFSTANPTIKNDTVIFCGRVIHQKHQEEEEEEYPRRRALWGSESFNKSQKFHSARFTGNTRSSSLRVPATGSFRYQKCESKKHKVIIGLAKIQPQMELSEIRKRQARRGPVPMIPFSTANPTIKNDTVIFCGRVIHQKHQEEEEEEYPRRRALWGSESFNKSQKFHSARFTGNTRSSSLRVPATGSFRYQKCESKKHKVIIGLAKIQPQMELSEIRKRQARRGPVPMIPVVVDGTEPLIAGGDGGKKSGGNGPAKSPWALLRPLRCRAHFASVLARASSACFPLL
ncbi:hypothetical protein CFP56_007866 [Quercus suber]|uniref:Uncharacterized protein n=1 Tax=Quercus suber TaxID=58331 RepID=A0AAW0L6M4_QUESU